MTTTEPLLEAKDLRKSYGDREVLRGLSLTLQPGERLALTGPSGCGKSTLLNCLGGVDRPDGGELWLEGERMDQMGSNALARLRRRTVGTIFQFFHLLPTLSVRENIELPLQLLNISGEERKERVRGLIERVGLTHRAEAYPAQLSGGEMQRVALARALASRPRLILADEPTGSLDTATGEKILTLIEELAQEHSIALVLVTHSEAAARICSRSLQMRDGEIVEEAVAG